MGNRRFAARPQCGPGFQKMQVLMRERDKILNIVGFTLDNMEKLDAYVKARVQQKGGPCDPTCVYRGVLARIRKGEGLEEVAGE